MAISCTRAMRFCSFGSKAELIVGSALTPITEDIDHWLFSSQFLARIYWEQSARKGPWGLPSDGPTDRRSWFRLTKQPTKPSTSHPMTIVHCYSFFGFGFESVIICMIAPRSSTRGRSKFWFAYIPVMNPTAKRIACRPGAGIHAGSLVL